MLAGLRLGFMGDKALNAKIEVMRIFARWNRSLVDSFDKLEDERDREVFASEKGAEWDTAEIRSVALEVVVASPADAGCEIGPNDFSRA